VPRKYHRPPDTTTKKRKPRRTAIPYEFTAAPEEATNGDDATDVEGYEADSAVAVDVRRTPAPATPVRDAHGRLERHVNRDYGYVQGEVIRIVAIAGFLIIALIITSIFR
jgi:hypothetical protein